MARPTLHLASSSPRRRALLEALGLEFTAGGVDIPEARLEGEDPRDMVVRLATEKAVAAHPGSRQLVLGADTAVVLDGRVLGKPRGEADALEMLAALSGRTHRVLTGVALRSEGAVNTAVSGTDVVFREIRPDEARRYWQSGEPADKAGGYAVQGLGGLFVASINGSYTGVVGLPVYETAALLQAAGLDVLAGDE